MATKAIQVELLLGGVMDDGDVALAGGKVFTYAAGTLTNKTTWTDRDKASPATNPIILDAAGKATIFADGVYKFVIKDANDVTIRTIDNLEFGFGFTGTVSFSKGADIASASALSIGTDGNYFDVTGTTTISSINTVGIGTVIKLHFDDILTLTHHATNLILPGGASIVTAVGDEAEFIEYATGNWICTNYQKTNGLPVNVFAKGADVVSETALFTIEDFPADGNYFDITGTTAITSIITSGHIGTVVKLHFDGALILTHHATNLILPGGGNITTSAGHEAEFIEYDTGKWRLVSYLGKIIHIKGADVASANALPIITDGDYFDVTGTTTITSINGIGVGSKIKLHFDGALTLTHHATDLILPGNANILTVAGDEAEFVEYSAGDWRLVSFLPYAGIGKIIAMSNVEDGAVATGSTQTPDDDSIPQNNEGNEFMTLSHTPADATNILYIQVTCVMSSSASGQLLIAALFKDSVADALAAAYGAETTAEFGETITFTHKMTAGTVSAITFKVRGGGNGVGTVTFNGSGGVRKFGGVMASSITVTEIRA